jgi:hypothetical protein
VWVTIWRCMSLELYNENICFNPTNINNPYAHRGS